MIQFDSRKIKKGDTFVAIKGLTVDGHDFVKETIKKGAVKIYGEKDLKIKNYIKVKDSRKKLAELASEYYGNPSKKLKVIGVTGTKGKTTTAHMIAHILEKSNKKVGLISSISDTGYHVTSPDIVIVNKYLSKIVKEKKEYVVLEVSSHGIEQGRVGGIKFDVTVLTNIKPEHLDYHKNFKEYKKIKEGWFKTGKIKVKSPIKTNINIFPGEFNNINAATAARVTKILGVSDESAQKALKSFKLPVGRMEEIENKNGYKVFVDFAHTPDSLEKALTYLKSITKGKLISVFGCAGERDTQKRPKMGKIAAKLSDIVVLTAEDPRTEKLDDIISQIQSGIKKTDAKVYKIPDRKKAIEKAIKLAQKGDLIGIFGKGHEKSMNLDGVHEIPWSDQAVVRSLLK